MVHITTTYLPYKKPEPSLAPEGLGPWGTCPLNPDDNLALQP